MRATGPEVVQEVLLAAHARGFKIVESPFLFVERRYGDSTFNRRILLHSLAAMWRLRTNPGRLVPAPESALDPARAAAQKLTPVPGVLTAPLSWAYGIGRRAHRAWNVSGPVRRQRLPEIDERARIARIDHGASVEGDAAGDHIEASAKTDLGGAGRTKLQHVEIPVIGIADHLAADALEHGAGQRHVLDADTEPDRDRRARCAAEEVRKGLDRNQRPSTARFRQAEQAVEINLGRGETYHQLRTRAEGQVCVAPQPDRAIVWPILELDLLKHGGGAIAADTAGVTP
jgi:hypothetical protein